MNTLSQNHEQRVGLALTGLQWVLGVVCLSEAAIFVLTPSARHEFGRTHMPQIIRLLLGWGEIVGAVLFLIPRTAVRGAWLLLIIFLAAILLHFLHGMPNVGPLVVYAAAAWAIAFGKGPQEHLQ